MGTWLKFTLLIDGEKVDEEWVDTALDEAGDVAERVAARQRALAEPAFAANKVVRLEMFDPDLPPPTATLVVSTSPAGMAHPSPVQTGDELADAVTAEFLARHQAADR